MSDTNDSLAPSEVTLLCAECGAELERPGEPPPPAAVLLCDGHYPAAAGGLAQRRRAIADALTALSRAHGGHVAVLRRRA